MSDKAKNIVEKLEAIYSPVACATMVIQGTERVIEASKACLNLAASQNAEIVANTRKVLQGTPFAELPIFGLIGQAVEGYVAIQNELLDLSLEQITAVINAFQVTGTSVEMAKSEFANVLQTSADRATAAQNTVMAYAAKQTKAGIEAVKAQPGITGTDAETVADNIQRGFDTVIATHKELVAMAGNQIKSVAARV